MSRVPRFARLAGACALVLSALALGMAPADAVTSSPAVAATGSFEVVTTGTATLTYSGFAPGTAVVFFYAEGTGCPDPAGTAITDAPLYSIGTGAGSTLGASPVTISQGAAVNTGFTGAATTLPGGAYQLCLYNVVTNPEVYLITSTVTRIYIPVTSSFVTNSDGTITLTYANANVDVDQNGVLLLAAGVTACPDLTSLATLNGFVFQFGYGPGSITPDTPSGTVIGVGTLALKLPITGPADIEPKPVTAGVYQVCLYQTDSTGSTTVHQSASFDLGAAAVIPVPATPTFTG